MFAFNNQPAWEQAADLLILPVASIISRSEWLTEIDKMLNGAISKLSAEGELTGKSGESITIYPPLLATEKFKCKKLLLLGCGDTEKLSLTDVETLIAPILRKVCEKPGLRLCIDLTSLINSQLSTDTLCHVLALQAEVASMDQAIYVAEKKRHPLAELILCSSPSQSNSDIHNQAIHQGKIIGQGINLTRELVNRGPHDIYPEILANKASAVATDVNLKCEVWDIIKLQAEKMGSMLGVAQGSSKPPFMVMLEYIGDPNSQEVLALVGKGVTFDSGGLCIKQPDGMKTMKCDMAGAATVLGVMSVVGQLKPQLNVRGYLGLVENMISGEAYRLGDVLTAKNGVTIEVMNTDAEGRLVLADVLCVAVEHGATKIIDLATLTGACVIALGEEMTGVFTNQDEFAKQLLAASIEVGEDSWQLPMHDSFNDQLKSDVADCKNVGTRWGGATTAAKFLQKFVSNIPWVHLDIAGPAYAASAKGSREAGATGVMVKTLVKLITQSAVR